MIRERIRIVVRGAVQGVGFRPFVFRLATELQLEGWVLNSVQGVFIEGEGPRDSLNRFLLRLEKERPPRAAIQSFESSFLDPVNYTGFEIRQSQESGRKTALILPDIATCADCVSEIFDPTDRRFGYPFTNCTNCGPRFTIIRDIPYDRPFTTMAAFEMCQTCLAEYHDPTDRRFHAQPNACSECGPGLSLVQSGGSFSDIKFATGASSLSILAQVRGLLHEGQIIAIRGMGGFHLACDASNAKALTRLHQRKRRSYKPFAVMVPDIGVAAALCAVSSVER